MKKLVLFLLPVIWSCSRPGTTVSPVRKDIVETVYASGKIIPENEYHVFALGNGIVLKKFVKEGESVPAGGLLYQIESDAPAARLYAAAALLQNARDNVSGQSRILNDLRLAMDNASARFTNDSLNYFRLKKLLDQEAASKSSVDNAFTAYTVSANLKKSTEEKYHATMNELNVALQNAKSLEAAARSDFENHSIRSGSAGTVFQLMKEEGEAVRSGEVVALLGETSRRIIKLAVDQQDIDKIKPGQEVLLKTDVTGNTIYHAAVTRIYPVMNEIDQTFRVDATFQDSVKHPYVHSSVEANILISQKKNALIIPRAALVAEDSVLLKTDGEPKNHFVQTGIVTLDDVEILKGLDESSRVIIPNQK